MRSKKKLLNTAKLYLILDRQVNSYEQLFEIAKQAIRGGVDIIQLRDKHGSAKDILKFSEKILRVTKNQIPYIVNDRVDLAVSSCANGVHLGQDDLTIPQAHKLIGHKFIIGASCQTLAHAREAVRQGADYIGFGSVYKTQTKPDRAAMNSKLLKNVMREIDIPVFAIGGIELNNIDQLKANGVARIAVCRAICQSKNVINTSKLFKQGIEEIYESKN